MKVGYLALFMDLDINKTWDKLTDFAYKSLGFYGNKGIFLPLSFLEIITKHVSYSILHWSGLTPSEK